MKFFLSIFLLATIGFLNEASSQVPVMLQQVHSPKTEAVPEESEYEKSLKEKFKKTPEELDDLKSRYQPPGEPNKIDYSGTAVPLDLGDEKFKGYDGIYLEMDIIDDKRIALRNESKAEIKFQKNSGNKISCYTSWELIEKECSEKTNKFIRERKNGLKPEESVTSLVFKVVGINRYQDFDFQVENNILHLSSYPCFENSSACRLHIVKPGNKESQIIRDWRDNLTVSYHLLNKLNGFKEIPAVLAPNDGANLLPKDFNYKNEYFTMVGRYLNLSVTDQWNDPRFISVYDSPDMKNSPVFFIGSSNLIIQVREKECFENDVGKRIIRHPNGYEEKCPFDLNWIHLDFGNSNSMEQEIYLKFTEYNVEKNIVTLDGNGKLFYINLDHCKKKHKCKFVFYPETKYQNDLLELEVLKKDKSFEPLNELKFHLDKCVADKNVECIKKQFLSKEEEHKVDEEACIDSSVTVPDYSFTLKDLPELKECLKYENLMFHRLASKGKNKICIFAPQNVMKERSYDQDTVYRFLSISPFNELKHDYRNYSYGSIVKVPPLSQEKVDELRAQLKAK